MSVKLPSFKILLDASEAESPGELFSTLSFGFGLLWAWYSVTLYSNFSVQKADYLSIPSFVPFVSLVCFILTAALIMCYTKPLTSFLSSKETSVIAGTCCAAGTLCILLTTFFPSLGTIALTASGLFSGFGGGCLFVLWGAEYSKRNASSATMNTVCALGVGITIFILASAFGQIAVMVAGIIAALIQIPFLLNSQAQNDKPESRLFSKLSTSRIIFILRIGTAAIPLGFALGTLRTLFFLSFERGGAAFSYLLVLAMACISTFFIVFGVLLSKKTDEYGSLLKPFLLIVAFAVITIPLFDLSTQQSTFPDFMLLVSYLCFEVCVWVFFAQISNAFSLSPFLVFGIGETFVCVGKFIELALQEPLVALFGTQSLFGVETAALILFSLLLGFCLLPSEKEVERMVVEGAWKKGDPDKPGYFKSRCDHVSTQYSLSNRESEILLYLAKGRNASFIQEKLVISEGTAKTHIWRIYRKLDVHTQQELINLVETIDIE